MDLDSKCEGKPVYKGETGPNKIIHFTKITLTVNRGQIIGDKETGVETDPGQK